jgi:hypothetical protein
MNNFHQDFPALMSDGRSFSNWQPTAVLNDQIRTRENLKTNWEYRQYLQKNANSIITFDQSTACQQTGCPYAYVQSQPSYPSDLKESFETEQGKKTKTKYSFNVNSLPRNA